MEEEDKDFLSHFCKWLCDNEYLLKKSTIDDVIAEYDKYLKDQPIYVNGKLLEPRAEDEGKIKVHFSGMQKPINQFDLAPEKHTLDYMFCLINSDGKTVLETNNWSVIRSEFFKEEHVNSVIHKNNNGTITLIRHTDRENQINLKTYIKNKYN
jgi:hypothetical protein